MERPRCAHCYEILGVYEPVRVIQHDGTELDGSALTLGEQLGAPGNVVLHARCYAPFMLGDGRGPPDAIR